MKKIERVLEKVKSDFNKLKNEKTSYLSEYEQGCKQGNEDALNDLIFYLEQIIAEQKKIK